MVKPRFSENGVRQIGEFIEIAGNCKDIQESNPE